MREARTVPSKGIQARQACHLWFPSCVLAPRPQSGDASRRPSRHPGHIKHVLRSFRSLRKVRQERLCPRGPVSCIGSSTVLRVSVEFASNGSGEYRLGFLRTYLAYFILLLIKACCQIGWVLAAAPELSPHSQGTSVIHSNSQPWRAHSALRRSSSQSSRFSGLHARGLRIHA